MTPNDTVFPPTALGREKNMDIVTVSSSKGRNCTLKRQITPAENGGGTFRSVKENPDTKRVLVFFFLNQKGWEGMVL